LWPLDLFDETKGFSLGHANNRSLLLIFFWVEMRDFNLQQNLNNKLSTAMAMRSKLHKRIPARVKKSIEQLKAGATKPLSPP
jgi:hypothetical protein